MSSIIDKILKVLGACTLTILFLAFYPLAFIIGASCMALREGWRSGFQKP